MDRVAVDKRAHKRRGTQLPGAVQLPVVRIDHPSGAFLGHQEQGVGASREEHGGARHPGYTGDLSFPLEAVVAFEPSDRTLAVDNDAVPLQRNRDGVHATFGAPFAFRCALKIDR